MFEGSLPGQVTFLVRSCGRLPIPYPGLGVVSIEKEVYQLVHILYKRYAWHDLPLSQLETHGTLGDVVFVHHE